MLPRLRSPQVAMLMSLGCLAGSSASLAQTESPEAAPPPAQTDKSAIQNIVVTARKREENLQDVPISVSAFTAADLEAKSLDSLKDVGQFTPNFSFSNSPVRARGGGAVFIRGVGQQEADIMWEPGVGVYIDGVYIARMQALDQDLMDLERVEILRGPQGTLFGKNTIGGAVNLVAARPTDDFHGRAEITAGSFNRRDAKLSLNVPIIPGTLSGKFAIGSYNQDGYGKRIDFATGNTFDKTGDTDSLSGRASLYWKAGEATDVLWSFDARRGREQGPAFKLVATSSPGLVTQLNSFIDPEYGNIFLTDDNYTNYGDGPNFVHSDTWGTALNITHDFGGWQFKSITGYRDLDVQTGTDLDGSPVDIVEQTPRYVQHQLSQEFQFSGQALASKLNWLMGLYYFEEHAFENKPTLIMAPLLAFANRDFTATPQAWLDVKSYAVFGQTTYALTDKLSATTGLRYGRDDKEVTRLRTSALTGALLVPSATLDESWDAVSGTAGLEYRWTPDLMTYLSAGRGFKSGGFNTESTNLLDFHTYDPEYIWTYELGMKSEFFERRLLLNAAVFLSNYTDQQFLVRGIDPVTSQVTNFVKNAAKSRIKGFELQLDANVAEGLRLSAGVGYVDAEYLEVEPGSPVTVNTEFVETPKWTFNTSAEYSHPVSSRGTLTGRLDYSHKTKIQHDLGNSPYALQPAYGLLNGRVTFDNAAGNWSFAVFGTNLTDEDYIAGGTSFLGNLGFATVQYAKPREWGADFRYSF